MGGFGAPFSFDDPGCVDEHARLDFHSPTIQILVRLHEQPEIIALDDPRRRELLAGLWRNKVLQFSQSSIGTLRCSLATASRTFLRTGCCRFDQRNRYQRVDPIRSRHCYETRDEPDQFGHAVGTLPRLAWPRGQVPSTLIRSHEIFPTLLTLKDHFHRLTNGTLTARQRRDEIRCPADFRSRVGNRNR